LEKFWDSVWEFTGIIASEKWETVKNIFDSRWCKMWKCAKFRNGLLGVN
jgi:hypothetical protein